MASCTQIDHQIQSYLDGELPQSDRAILELHLAECPVCVQALRRHQRSNASLFEVFVPARLSRDMTEYVLSHLPEMEPIALDVARLNRRAKHPAPWRENMFRLMPIAAAALLVVLAALINARWPDPAVPDDAIGVVAATQGLVSRVAKDTGTRARARERVWAQPGDRIETAADGMASLLLVGPSELRMAQDSIVRVDSERQITIEKGRVWLDVAHSQRFFKVMTPMGEVTVFGTRFEVFAEPHRTTVTVHEGEVQLSHRENDRVFRILRPDQQAYVEHGSEEIPMQTVDSDLVMAWAGAVSAPTPVRDFFAQRVQPGHEVHPISGEGGYFLQTDGRPLKSLHLTWTPTSSFQRYCDYDVFVYAPDNSAVFSAHVPGSTFDDARATELEIPNTGNDLKGFPTVFVKIVPMGGPDTARVEFRAVSGLIATEAR